MKLFNVYNCIGCWLTAALVFGIWLEYHLHKTYGKMHDHTGDKH